MSATIEDPRVREILAGRDVANVSVTRPDGSIQSVLAWVAEEEGLVTLNTADGRAWPANIEDSGRATITVMADGKSSEWISVELRLVDVSIDEGWEHIRKLAAKYGREFKPRSETETRKKLTLRPERVYHHVQ
jgi:hypothetical protein